MPFSQLHIALHELQDHKNRVEYSAVTDFVNYFKISKLMRKNKIILLPGEKCECHGALEIQHIRLAINMIPTPS